MHQGNARFEGLEPRSRGDVVGCLVERLRPLDFSGKSQRLPELLRTAAAHSGIENCSAANNEEIEPSGSAMDELIEFPLEGGGSVIVVASRESGPITRGGITRRAEPSELLSRADQTLETALGRVQPAAEALLKNVLSLANVPDSVEIRFGVVLSASIGAVIAKGSGEANFAVTLRWEKDAS